MSGAALAEVIAAVLGGQDGCLLSLGSSQSRPEQRWTMIGDINIYIIMIIIIFIIIIMIIITLR